MAKKIIVPEGVPKPMGPYSQAVAAPEGRLLFISGQVPEDADGNLIGKGDLESQTGQVLHNLRGVVEGAGGAVSDIVKITIFMVDTSPSSYEVVGRVRREFFGGDFPASTLVGVTGLAKPDWLIEIEAFAVIPDQLS